MITLDFETYSEAGYEWSESAGYFVKPALYNATGKDGIGLVGTDNYARHPSTTPLMLKYNVPDMGILSWRWGEENPSRLLDYVQRGGRIEGHNVFFEFMIWNYCCVPKLGWPPLRVEQCYCSADKARFNGVPGKLETAAQLIGFEQKDSDGHALIKLLSVPQKPTKNQPHITLTPDLAPDEHARFNEYCVQDVRAELSLSENLQPLSEFEERIRQYTLTTNINGLPIDVATLDRCCALLTELQDWANLEIQKLCPFSDITKVTESEKIFKYLNACYDLQLTNFDAEVKETLLKSCPIEHVKQIAKLCLDAGGAATKKYFALYHAVSRHDNKLRGMYIYCGAEQSSRWTSILVQLQNMSGKTLKARKCAVCGFISVKGAKHWGDEHCPECLGAHVETAWHQDAIEAAIYAVHNATLDQLRDYWGDPFELLKALFRSLITVEPGMCGVGADFKSIEAVTLAELAGERWRQEVFRDHGLIYEMSASKITGIPFQTFLDHKKETGKDLPERKKIGKVCELAGGYQGWISAYKRFGADEFMTDVEIEETARKWRQESPAIVALWHNLERCAKSAMQNPDTWYSYRYLHFIYLPDKKVLRMYVPSGDFLSYHHPLLESTERYGKPTTKITYLRRDTQTGKLVRADTYGGKLTENGNQKVARDILAHAILNLIDAGYTPLVNTHDEIFSQCPAALADVDKYCALICDIPSWATCPEMGPWPIRADGFLSQIYRKN